MKKLSIILMTCLVFTIASYAQQTEKFDPAKDKEEVRGYIIHLTPVPGNTFGFIILKDKNTIWSQTNNPFAPGRQNGFIHKADAYKLAEWVVSQNEANSHTPIIIKPQLAKQLNITEGLPKQ